MRSFLLVALVFVLIVVGAVVGGTVGRNASHTANTEVVASDQNLYVYCCSTHDDYSHVFQIINITTPLRRPHNRPFRT
jgi:hypothetical protein